jgi:hypothetical protein
MPRTVREVVELTHPRVAYFKNQVRFLHPGRANRPMRDAGEWNAGAELG